MYWLAKYGVQTSFRFSMIKRGVVDLAATADWTPATGDVKISLNGASAGNTTNLPTAIAGAGSVGWNLILTAAELTTSDVYVQLVDSATKAVEDNSFVVYTYGNAAAKIPADLSDLVRLGLTALPAADAQAAGGLYTRGTGAGQINQPTNGMIDGNVVRWLNTAVATPTTAGIPRVAIEAAADFAQTAADKVWLTVAGAGRTLTAFSTTLALSVWDVLEAAIVTASSLGLKLKTNVDAAVTSRLAPTVAARTLDVSATGEAGLDWANIGTPATAQALSGTTIAASQVIATISGNVNGSIGSVAANGITAASFAADTGLKPIRSGTAQAGSIATTIVLDASASAVDDFYRNCWVYITGGTLTAAIGQLRKIRTYTGSNKTAAMVRAWNTIPDNTSTFAILPEASVWDEFAADHTTAGTFGNVSGQQLTTSELLDKLKGPLATIVADGANTATVFRIDVPSVTELDPDWWKDALISFDDTATLAGQYRKVTAYNQTTGFVTVATAFTRIPTATNTARLVVR